MRSAHKLRVPAPERVMLRRERLLDRLRARWFTPVIVLSAPAGYGKTTLLTQALAANAAAPLGIDCWLACGPDTTTASSLGEGLCRAVGAAAPTTARGAGDGMDALVAAIAEALWRRSPQQVALVVDDVHEIRPASEAAELLAAVVASMPANGHVVLAGRPSVPWPPAEPAAEAGDDGEASDGRARRVDRLDESDLAFTDDELAEFAALRGVSASTVAGCGGWPALAELSATTRAETAGEYVGEEVLAPLPAATRRHLALLAHIGRFDDELARAVLGREVDVSAVLAGIPLVTVLPNGERRLHSLWESLLAREVPAAEIAGARRRAAAVLLRRDQANAAVRLLLDAEAWDDLAEAVVESLSAARTRVPFDILQDWLARLPPELAAHPSRQLLAAVVGSDSDPAGSWRQFEECAAAFRALGDTAGELACLVNLGELAWWSEQTERLAGVVARIFELEAAGSGEAHPLACLGRALVYDVLNDSQQVLTELDRIPPGSLSSLWQGLVLGFRAAAQMQLGHADAALETAEQGLERGEPAVTPMLGATKHHALWFQGRIGEVAGAMPELIERAMRSGYRHAASQAAAQGCLVHAFVGQLDEAAGYLARAQAVTISPGAPVVAAAVSVAEAALAVAEGDERRAAAVLAAEFSRHPVYTGLSAAAHQRGLALGYVLLPRTRPTWDSADLGPAFAVSRDLARAVVAVREDGRLPPGLPPLPPAGVVHARLPVPWVAELGVAGVAAGREDGARLLEETWPTARPAVARLAHDDGAPRPLRKAARSTLGALAVPPAARLELRVLGPLELRRDGELVRAPDWRRERARSLLAYLVLNRVVSREQLAGDLWPALDRDAQSRNLRVTLTYLLRVLEPERGHRDPSFFVRSQGNNLVLHPDTWLTVDIWVFDAACERAAEAHRQGSPSTELDHALRAVELWRGEPAELGSEPWAVGAMEQRRVRFAQLATRAGELLLARGDTDRARTLAAKALDIDPWLEAAHRLVVASHRAADDDLAARRALGRYRDAIRELGLSPGDATLMVERLLDND